MALKKSVPTSPSRESGGYRITHHRCVSSRVIHVLGEYAEKGRGESCYIPVEVSGFKTSFHTHCRADDGLEVTLVELLPRFKFFRTKSRQVFLLERRIADDKLRRRIAELKSQGPRAYVPRPWVHNNWYIAAYVFIFAAAVFHGVKSGFESIRSWEFIVPAASVALTFIAVRAYRWRQRRQHLLKAALSSFSYFIKGGTPVLPTPAGPTVAIDESIRARIAPLTVCDGIVERVKIEKRDVAMGDSSTTQYFFDLEMQGRKWVGESAAVPMIAVGDRLRIVGNTYDSEHWYVFGYRNYTDGHSLKAIHPSDKALGFPRFAFSDLLLMITGFGALCSAIILAIWIIMLVLIGPSDLAFIDWLRQTALVLGATGAFAVVLVIAVVLFDRSEWFWRNYRTKRLLLNLLGCRSWKEWWNYSESGA